MALNIVRRLCAAIVLIVAICAVVYLLIGSGGQSPGRSILGPGATPEQVAEQNHELGVDRPLPLQFWDWLSHAAEGDLGSSYVSNQPVADTLIEHLPVSLSIIVLNLIVVTVLSAVLAILAARGSVGTDRVVQTLVLIGHVVPAYLIALLLLLLFAVKLGLFPAFGYVPFAESPTEWFTALVLPVTALALGGVAGAALQARGALLDVLTTDYVRTLRSRGISERSILFRHALRNAAPPWLTSLSLAFAGMLGGTFLIEKVFAMPGLGTLATESTTAGDRPVIMGLVLLTGTIVVLINLLTDLAQMWLVPKARAA
ncbi:peptide/nickel transport system permease protein [Rhodococcus sp. LBL1]|nr:peptide/nickel transport system permease protein [Rhodococcus sp. LBL1]MDH6682131.1 peptide/nickel transport system permease protein [Rhodococcus sp. LBL2]